MRPDNATKVTSRICTKKENFHLNDLYKKIKPDDDYSRVSESTDHLEY